MSIAALIEAVEAGTFLMDVFDDGKTERIAYEAFGGSLDAAKALHEALLPGWEYLLSASNAKVFPYNGTAGASVKYGMAATPARAWLLAILRAYRGMQA